jgi:hypothetical protein
LLFRRWLNISSLIDRIKLAAFDGIKENLGGFLNALEEAVILRTSGSGFLIGVMTKNLLAVGTLDLLLCGSPAIFRKAKNSIMILSLK